MNLNFDDTLLLDGSRSYIASLAIVDPTNILPFEAHNRVEHRAASKSHRTPEKVREGLLRISPIAIPLSSGEHNLLLINASEEKLQDWAQRSQIQAYTYVQGEEAMRQLDDLIPWDLLRELNQKIHDNLIKISAGNAMDIDQILEWAHNRTGCKAAHIRRKVYSV